MSERLVNFSDAATRSSLIRNLNLLTGVYRFSVVRYRKRRSDNQNAYLFGAVYPAVAQGLKDVSGVSYTPDEAHEFCRAKFLSVPVVNHNTGEAVGRTIRSTAKLNTAEFAEYIEKIAAFAAEYLGTVIPEPNGVGV